MNLRAALIVAILGVIAASCTSEEAIAIDDAVLGVSVTSCERNISNRASAVVIGDGLALTVAHTFDGAADLVLSGGDIEFAGEVVYLDEGRDIALVSFEAPASATLNFLELHDDTSDPSDTARVLLLRDDLVVAESVELLRRTDVTLDGEGRRQGIEIAATIERGDSGAPLLDDDDRIIAMVFASSRVGETGWAVAGSELIDIADLAGDVIELTCP